MQVIQSYIDAVTLAVDSDEKAAV